MRIALVGFGAVGGRIARQLAVAPAVTELWVHHHDPASAAALAGALGPRVRAGIAGRFEDVDAVAVASPAGTHVSIARRAIAAGRPVVSVSDSIEDVSGLLALDALARERGVSVVAGAGLAPGLTDLLADFGRRSFDTVHEVHVAKFGTGGPACARQHHRALGDRGVEWRAGRWVPLAGGAGRRLSWFPEPVGGADCYHAALAEPILLREQFPRAVRLTARVAATRRDRLTARLPMLRRPHPEGTVGAVRVELRGERDGQRLVEVFGVSVAPAAGAAAVGAAATMTVAKGESGLGANGVASQLDGAALLGDLAGAGIRAEVFVGKS